MPVAHRSPNRSTALAPTPLQGAVPRDEPAASNRRNFGHLPPGLPLPDLLALGRESLRTFLADEVPALFDAISPIADGTGQHLELRLGAPTWGAPRDSVATCRHAARTYSAPRHVRTHLLRKATGEVVEAPVFLGAFPA